MTPTGPDDDHTGASDAPDEVYPVRRAAGQDESVRASLAWWDQQAEGYQASHGAFLGDARFVWGPEGLDEASAHLLGPTVAGLDVLEVGCGGAQCSRWLVAQGARRVVAVDLSAGMLVGARRLNAATGLRPWLVQADATRLPFAAASFDLACSAYGAVPFVADTAVVMREVARVLRPGGRWVFSVTHPIRRAFPDDPGTRGLTATMSYFDRDPYVEQDAAGRAGYVEHHRTLGDRVRELVAAGFVVEDVVEPEWPDDLEAQWGGWSPLRGRLLPGTAVFVSRCRDGAIPGAIA